ncbi:hypothetical protein [Paraburkholderia lacunae]|uniref:hypothetical protein n=1 Tax=Paraburkholderia lacunae TaxID=2211104 RepID=UPI001AD8150E|nr:hypothetical protein [Paraburkholderia lacunae]
MRSQIIDIIRAALENESAMHSEPISLADGEATALYGRNGQLDSMGLVSVVVDVEQGIERELGVRITLVSDGAMSARRSPFATIGSLADYALGLCGEVARV